MRALPLIGLVVSLTNCEVRVAPNAALPDEGAPAPRSDPPPEENNPAFHPKLASIAGAYESYGRVDDELRWAPWLCRMPMPGIARFSESTDASTHGLKLYSLFAQDREGYLHPKTNEVAPGQVIVKESWLLEEVPRDQVLARDRYELLPAEEAKLTDTQRIDLARMKSGFYPYAEKDGRSYRATQIAGIYVMFKGPPEAGTDEGWVYGTLTPGGTVTSAGRVGSCMGCHVTAPRERLFGLANIWP